ncbi:MAG: hypothetical protein RLZZ214_498 [Verrucomicrobiota bacterium]|jgi:hypothetical protein
MRLRAVIIRIPILLKTILTWATSILFILFSQLAPGEPANPAGAERIAGPSGRVERFRNAGVLAGWTGANQREKITESTAEDHDGNGRSLLCLMKKDEADTPKGGCHAEMHLSEFPDGTPLATGSDFKLFTSHWFKFDEDCRKIDIGIWQLKNHKGPEQWKYLVALWLESRGSGDELLFEVNPDGVDYNIYAKLSRDGLEPLKPGVWHHLEIVGHYNSNKQSWAAVRLNGKTLTWYADREGTQPIGMTWRGKALPAIANAGWQFQVGAYGFFNKRGPQQGRLWIDDIRVGTEAPTGK